MSHIFVISGPSGVGKDTLIQCLLAQPGLELVIPKSYTTRKPRQTGLDQKYIFVTEDEFEALLTEGEIIGFSRYAGHLYGTPKTEIDQIFAIGANVLRDVDFEGARAFRATFREATLVFITARLDDIHRRLVDRGQNSDEEIFLRLNAARDEMAGADFYDHIVMNEPGRLVRTVGQIVQIIRSCLRPA